MPSRTRSSAEVEEEEEDCDTDTDSDTDTDTDTDSDSDTDTTHQQQQQHPHYLLHRIDNRYRALLDTMDVHHARAIQELKDGYNAILRLQESLIFQQAEHIARLERQLRPLPTSPNLSPRSMPPVYEAGVGAGGRLSPPVPPKNGRRLSQALDLAQLDAILSAEGPPPPPPPKNRARPKSGRNSSFSTVVSDGTTTAEEHLERAAREQIRTWKRQVGSGAGTGTATATGTATESDSFEEEEEEAASRSGSGEETVRGALPVRSVSRATGSVRAPSVTGARGGGRTPYRPSTSGGTAAKLVKPSPAAVEKKQQKHQQQAKAAAEKPWKPVGLFRRLWHRGLGK
ncbi:hypothetical protein BZA05DRAFT_434083 [Tricharina praecox]|uniref:uncharacterized protein n=1 Tax=Tricharina praecox TaxID=43433 RepID=UPI00221F08D9|nr:uncharacterized protein BZA05DRAFT_434083 [Tricharina praecox]KAI5856539.1 hypothetical protein BZA05DRAFT_434083 [Tricharina praecox]